MKIGLIDVEGTWHGCAMGEHLELIEKLPHLAPFLHITRMLGEWHVMYEPHPRSGLNGDMIDTLFDWATENFIMLEEVEHMDGYVHDILFEGDYYA